MKIWPFESYQCFQIPKDLPTPDCSSESRNEEEAVLQLKILPQSNLLVVLTKTKVLLYNLKPFCLIGYHERAKESIGNFGTNRFAVTNLGYGERINGINTDSSDTGSNLYKGYICFYVITSDNYMLVYQVLTSKNAYTTSKECGIPVFDSQRRYIEVEQELVSEYDNDAELLIVSDRNDSSKIIQNGYAIDKQKRILQFLMNSEDIPDELPVKKSELRLKIVLKFDHKIKDVLGVLSGNVDDNDDQERLIVLFNHSLQLLRLSDFKLKSNTPIEIAEGIDISVVDSSLYVTTQDSDLNVSIHEVNFEQESLKTKNLELSLLNSKLLFTAPAEDTILLIYENDLIYYNFSTEKVSKHMKVQAKIKMFKQICADTFIILMDDSNINIVTFWGNVLFASNFRNSKDLSYKFTDIAYIDKTLIISTDDGQLLHWPMWEEMDTSANNGRNSAPFILQNRNNDVMLYSPMVGNIMEYNPFQLIKLPTKTVNNYISLVRINSPQTMLAMHVANKNILLINILHTGQWLTFPNITILDCQWIGSHYLLCHIFASEGEELLQCFHFPLQVHNSNNLEEYSIWDWQIPEDYRIGPIFANTLTSYKMVKIKGKRDDMATDTMFKTAEVIIVDKNNKFVVFEVISTVHSTVMNIIRRFHLYKKYLLPENSLKYLKWVVSLKGGFLALINHSIVKIEEQETDYCKITPVLEKVEKILDYSSDNISLVVENQFMVFHPSELWDNEQPFVTLPISEDEYPMTVTTETTTMHNLHCYFRPHVTKLVASHYIYLDQIVARLCDDGVPAEDINTKYSSIRHYKFALEKVLSKKVLDNEPLDGILELIDVYDLEGHHHKNVAKLEIVSNCLRKVETKHWNYLFQNLNLTPRDLLKECTENGEAKILGVLLIVFLNYDDSDQLFSSNLTGPKTTAKKQKKPKSDNKHTTKSSNNKSSSTSPDALQHEELIKRVLKMLVASASSSSKPQEAQEYWELALQIVRFVKAFDKQNSTKLLSMCLDQL
ncbi:Ric1p Ecym_6068 [Eremothecium cymbalariae DBVPG|uniref:RIC1 C-terminal alpha solenoid region domain-containing protein n=1 Tax=Eremothecium cymbalariae (strain CBS 270.75 / DBVPG 7215 / KCTC 17166 / NRRL Y-17582) TaxID=931890 RepID=G8JUY9_ERECY|nr:hypothetical protein Ecym_6068 [Eremothecium cymbalariae DBVPG\